MKTLLLVLLALVVCPSLALAGPLEDRVATLEKDAEALRSALHVAIAVSAILGLGALAAVKKGASWVSAQVRTTFDRALGDHGIPLEKLSGIVDWKDKLDKRRSKSTILVVSDGADRALQTSLQRHGFRLVTVLEPGQAAIEAARLAGLVVLDVAKPGTWDAWGDALVRDAGRDDYLLFTGTSRVYVPGELAARIMMAKAPLTLAVHAAALLARAEERRDVEA
jgi:hypothetical protein